MFALNLSRNSNVFFLIYSALKVKSGGIQMNGSIKSQKFMSLIFIIFAFIGLAQHYITSTYINITNYNIYLYAYIGIILINIINLLTLKFSERFSIIFYGFRFAELHFITILTVLPSLTLSSFFLLAALLTISRVIKGSHGALIIAFLAIINYVLSTSLGILLNFATQPILIYILDFNSIILIGFFFYTISKSSEETFKHLEQAHEETTKNNQLLNNTIAELSTLQEISKFANSVLNIKELINIINDMIIGVIGVNYCSIFLIEENIENIYLETSNIQDKNILQNIKLTLASKYLKQFKSRGLTMIEGNVDEIYDYPFAKQRDVKTFLITSLQSHRNFLGLVVIESSFDGIFGERKKNMITTICNQVSIAIENAVIYDKMERLATIDGLTQVHNRRYFNEKCLAEFANLANCSPVSIAMIDIDNFKKINDTYGHLIGDSVLKKIASIINSTTCAANSEDFLVARYGGEEFVILMRNTNLQTAFTTLEVVRKNIASSSVDDEGQKIKFTVSIGVAEYPATSQDVKQILRDADTALYKAKETGKNKVVSAEQIG